MRVICLYKRETDYGREVEEYLNEIERYATESKVEVLDPESRDGESIARAYDIVRYPTFLVLNSDDGSVVRQWMGMPLPVMDEVVHYL